MRRRLILSVVVVLAILLAVNTIVTNNETKPAKADIGRVLDLPGGDMQVREDGVRTGTPLVLLHGFASSMHWWTPLVQRLKSDYRLIRIDLLGHGGSEKPGSGYSMEHQAEQVASVLSVLRVKQAVILGHSMGGVVATAFAERYPKQVEGLFLIDTPSTKDAGKLPFLARLGFVPVLGQAIRRFVPNRTVKKNLEKAFAPGFDVPEQFVEDFRRMTYTSYDESHSESNDFNGKRSVADRLAAVGKPLLVIQGAKDQLVDPDTAQNYHRVPGARVVLLPNTGHSAMVEQPGETARLVREFVRSLSKRR